MRILILALTFGLGLTLNAKMENGITKKDSIHFIDGVLIMANDTISLNKFTFLARMRCEIATARYLKQAVQEMINAEYPQLAKKQRDPNIRGSALIGVLGIAMYANGLNLIDNAVYSSIASIPSTGEILGGLSLVFGASAATVGFGGAAIGAAQSARPLTSSAHHNLEADRLIDKAVNSYNKQNLIDKAVNSYNKQSRPTLFSKLNRPTLFSEPESLKALKISDKKDGVLIMANDTTSLNKSVEMKVFGSRIYTGGRLISLSIAKKMSFKSSPEANAHFKKAMRIEYVKALRVLAVEWVVLYGGLNRLFADQYPDTPSIASANAVMAGALGTGAVLVRGIYLGEFKRTQQIIMGVKAYNKAIASLAPL